MEIGFSLLNGIAGQSIHATNKVRQNALKLFCLILQQPDKVVTYGSMKIKHMLTNRIETVLGFWSIAITFMASISTIVME